jgi:predicted GIY-YIG superfamily endonuclease
LKTYYLYVLRHPITNELRYVGQTSQRPRARLAAHVCASSNPSSIVSKWAVKLVREGIRPQIQVVAQSRSSEYIDRLEIAAIRGLRKRGHRLLNQARGGSVNRGYTMSDEFRKVVSARFKGKPSHLRGKKLPPEHIKAIAETRAKRKAEGKYPRKKLSPETLAKIKTTKLAKGTFHRKRTTREIELVSEMNRRLWKDPEWVAKQTESIAGNAEKSRQRWTDPEYKARVIAASKEAKIRKQTPEIKAKLVQRQSELWADPEYKARRSAAIRAGRQRQMSQGGGLKNEQSASSNVGGDAAERSAAAK